jgi:hypothetical protein
MAPLTTTLINRFERSCGTFKGRGGNPMLSLGHFAQEKKKIIN